MSGKGDSLDLDNYLPWVLLCITTDPLGAERKKNEERVDSRMDTQIDRCYIMADFFFHF